MNGTRDAVLQLEVHLGDGVLGKDRGVRDVTWKKRNVSTKINGRFIGFGSMYRTNGSRLNHVADGESLDGLILGRASRAVAAADGLGVAAALLVAAVVLSL